MFVAFGDSEPAARLFQSVAVALTVFVAVAFTRQVSGSALAAFATGAALVASWWLYESASVLQTEWLFTFLLLLFVVVFVQRRYLLAGTLFGALLLTRGTLIFAIPLLIWRVRCDD
jgi:Gpi18-like mannosyltransferase